MLALAVLCQGMTRLVTTHWHRPCLPHNAGIGDTHSCQSCGDNAPARRRLPRIRGRRWALLASGLPWGHKEGEQDIDQFAAYYKPDLITPEKLQEVGFLDAYSQFASAKTHMKSDYITISLVRVTSGVQAVALTSKFQEDLTIGLTPAPPGGTVTRITISGIPGSEAYLSWFEGPAALDAVFVRGDVVADIERTSSSKTVADHFQTFARQLYARLKVGTTSVT
jgi:hypothetical protein